jgi:histidinol dehydrogenase
MHALQAEHDVDATPYLVTTNDPKLPALVNAELTKQLATLSAAEVAKVSTAKGCAVLCETLDEAVAVANQLAPEHLEVQRPHLGL